MDVWGGISHYPGPFQLQFAPCLSITFLAGGSTLSWWVWGKLSWFTVFLSSPTPLNALKQAKPPTHIATLIPFPFPTFRDTGKISGWQKAKHFPRRHTTMEQLLGRLECFDSFWSYTLPRDSMKYRELKGMEWWLSGFHTGAESSSLPLHRQRNEGHSPAFCDVITLLNITKATPSFLKKARLDKWSEK